MALIFSVFTNLIWTMSEIFPKKKKKKKNKVGMKSEFTALEAESRATELLNIKLTCMKIQNSLRNLYSSCTNLHMH